jgi:hypothetical protein
VSIFPNSVSLPPDVATPTASCEGAEGVSYHTSNNRSCWDVGGVGRMLVKGCTYHDRAAWLEGVGYGHGGMVGMVGVVGAVDMVDMPFIPAVLAWASP